MDLRNKLKDILIKIDSLHMEDPRIGGCFDEIVFIFSQDENETIRVLPLLSEDEISWVAPNFAEISGQLQSKKFIQCLEHIGNKYPDLVHLQSDIADAREAMDEL